MDDKTVVKESTIQINIGLNAENIPIAMDWFSTDNPDKIETPWYGQLMRAPQIMAYIIELDEWFKTYNVEIDI